MVSVLYKYFRDLGSNRWSLFISLGKETDAEELYLSICLDVHCTAPNQAQQAGWTRGTGLVLLSLHWQKCKALPEKENSYLGYTLYISFQLLCCQRPSVTVSHREGLHLS